MSHIERCCLDGSIFLDIRVTNENHSSDSGLHSVLPKFYLPCSGFGCSSMYWSSTTSYAFTIKMAVQQSRWV